MQFIWDNFFNTFFLDNFLMHFILQVHGDYKEDLGTKVERPADDLAAEGETEVVGA